MNPDELKRAFDALDDKIAGESSLLVAIGYWLLAVSVWVVAFALVFALWEILK